MKKIFTPIFFLFSVTSVLAQNEAKYWYFGVNAGLHFSQATSMPTALTDGQLVQREGCSSISDKNTGSLLFYTDGLTVFNSNHQVMQNGTDLQGNESSTQSALIVPKPGSTDKYYVFTCGVNSNMPATGVRYSEVDLATNSVLTSNKNTLLLAPGVNSEKMAGTLHSNGTDYWVVVHDLGNTYYSFLVTSAGVSTTPVISTIGSSHAGQFNNVGYLKFSPSGTLLANAINGDQKKVEIFSFNALTGVVSSPGITISDVSAAYGVEFSQSERYLYISNLNRPNTVYTGIAQVCQYDLLAGSEADINLSKNVYRSSTTIGFGALQLAPNGAILVSSEATGPIGQTHLDMIVKPDNAGAAASYALNAVAVGSSSNSRRTFIGLPNFLSHYFRPATVSASEEVFAQKADILLFPNPTRKILNYKLTEPPATGQKSFALFDLTGRQIVEKNLNAHEGTINLPDLPQGSYSVIFTSATAIVNQVLIIQ